MDGPLPFFICIPSFWCTRSLAWPSVGPWRLRGSADTLDITCYSNIIEARICPLGPQFWLGCCSKQIKSSRMMTSLTRLECNRCLWSILAKRMTCIKWPIQIQRQYYNFYFYLLVLHWFPLNSNFGVYTYALVK